MSDQQDESIIVKEDNSPLLGLRLRQAREHKKLTISETATQLRISQSAIEALEHEKWEHLHGRIYARGYFMNYVKFLGLPMDDMLTLFNQKYIENEKPQSFVKKSQLDEKPFPWAIWLTIISVLIVLWFAYAQWQAQHAAEPIDETPELSYFNEPVLEDLIPRAQADVPNTYEEASIVLSDTDAVEAADSTEEGLTEEVEISLSSESHIVLRIGAECWVEVIDSLGGSLYSRIAKNEVINLSGVAPFRVRLGNVSAVELTYNDEVVDLTPYSQGNVARLTLGADA